MAKINKIRLSGVTFDIEDLNAPSAIEVTQAQYDALVSGGTVDPTAFYIITDAQAGDLTQYWTSAQTNSAITEATSGKVDTSTFETYSGSVATALSGKADTATTYSKTEVDNAITAATSTKQDTLVSGTNIKTINNESILGSGNIDIQGGGGGITSGEVQTMIDNSISGKQDTLVSGTNIKTINNESLLGSGNINIQGGGGKAIEAGRGISITTGETADTVSFDLPIYKTVSGTAYSLVLNSSSQPSANIFKTKHNTYINCTSPYVEDNSGTSNLIMGEACSAMSYASQSFVGGYKSKIGDARTFAFGLYSEALRYGAVAFGYDAQAFKPQVSKGNGSFACGGGTSANTHYSFATGYHTFTTIRSEFTSGQYNNSVSATTTFGDSGNTLFSVGNGTADNARHNAFEIRQNGDIYITSGGTDIKLQDNLGGGGSSITIDPSLDSGSTNAVANSAITNAINAVSGAIPTTTSAVTSGSTAVVESGAVYDQLGGMKIVKLTESEYTQLVTKDNDTLYVVIPDPSN